jgi:predicted membrane-bound spermidine synthase
MAEHPPTGETYGHLTGRKRLTIMLLGAVSGLAVAIMFAFFAQRAVPTIELIIGAAIGALLGLSASLGERRRKRARPD